MISCAFLPLFYEHHQCRKTGRPLPHVPGYDQVETIWLGFYGLGKLETYQFVYTQCTGITHLQEWMKERKGETALQEAAAAFAQWNSQRDTNTTPMQAASSMLTADQWQHWREKGFLRISGLVPVALCDAVVQLICSELGVNLPDPATWYNNHPDWHGLMLQLYQAESIAAIRTLPAIRDVFTALYNSDRIIANTEKLSFNPPETATWKFRHGQLHWDVDFANPDPYYIQGLVYLNDVPANRGPLTLVPGFHHQYEDWMKRYTDPDAAHRQMRNTCTGEPVPGQKGDIVVWLQNLPHAASANHDTMPRFVQYISFSKL